MCGDNIRAHQRGRFSQGFREGIRRNGRFQKRGLQGGLIGNRDGGRGLRLDGIPEAMGGIGGKVAQGFVTQGFFQRFAVFIRGNMSHDDAQTGIVPLCLKRLLNAAEGTLQIFKNLALKAVHGSAVQACSAGKDFMRGIRGSKVSGDFRFNARFHGYPVGQGRSGVDGLGEGQEATEKNGLQEYYVMPHDHAVSPEKAVKVEERAVAPF